MQSKWSEILKQALKLVSTHMRPFVTVVNVKQFPIEGDVYAYIEIFPVPAVTKIILGQALSFDKFTLRDSTGRERGGN